MTTAHVSGYTRKDGTHVSSYTQGRPTGTAPGRHRSLKGRAQLAGAGGLAFIGAVQMLTAVMNVVTAVLTVSASSLVAWGGYKGVQKKRKKGRRKSSARGGLAARFGTIRTSSPAQIEAMGKVTLMKRQARQVRRDEVWGRRKTAAGRVVRTTGHAVASGARAVGTKVRAP